MVGRPQAAIRRIAGLTWMPRFLFYITGHGFGHARRMAQVARALAARSAGSSIHIRTAAPAHIFEPLPGINVDHSNIDCGLIEKDALTIDREASLTRLVGFMRGRDAIIGHELTVVRAIEPALIVADIPFLAGDVATAAGAACVGISNFTWDWIYENLFGDDPRYADLAPAIVAGYAKMNALLELPFGQTCPAIGHKIPTPLIAAHSVRDKQQILCGLGLADDVRPRVLLGMRGGLPPDTLIAGVQDAPAFLFLCPHAPATGLPDNARGIIIGPDLDFSDAVAISDVVISKLGYGIVSDCIAAQARLLWPPREGFAEDQVMAARAPRSLRMLPIPRDDFRHGRWGSYLREAMQLAAVLDLPRTDGAGVCADFLMRMVKAPPPDRS